MSTNENRRAGVEARNAVVKATGPLSRHEVAMQHYLAAAAYHERVEQARPATSPERRDEGATPAAGSVSDAPTPDIQRAAKPTPADEARSEISSRRTDLIVVGVDESVGSARAVDWAVAEAERRHGSLRLVHAVAGLANTPEGAVYGLVSLDENPQHSDEQAAMLVARAESLLDRVAADLRRAHPALDVTTRLVRDNAAAALRQESEHAGLTVVGSRGAGRLTGVILGSVALTIASDNPAPVAVIHRHDPIEPVGPVVVGVDGSATSQGAIALAFEAAASRHAELLAVHSWNDTVVDGEFPDFPLLVDPVAIEQEERALLSEQLAGWVDKYPDVPVQQHVVRSRPTPALLDASSTAQLVVVGSRGRAGFAGLLLGSSSHALIAHGRCPVIVVR